MSLAELFNPSRDSTGVTLYEHWEQDSRGRANLLYISSTPPVALAPGDLVIQRVYAPASAPHVTRGSTSFHRQGETS